MDLPSPDTLAIRQLQIRRATGAGGADADQRVPRATVTRLQQQLDQADWPDTGEAWVFIRSVAARGSARQLGERLTGATRERLRQPDGKEVVRFANLSELLAALIADLLTGQASQRWYWQRWNRLLTLPVVQSIRQVLQGQTELLPTLCARLHQQGLLPRLWTALNADTARILATELAWRMATPLPTRQQIQLEQQRLQQADPSLPIWLQPPAAGWRARWQPLLANRDPTEPQVSLALLLIGLEIAPLMLQRAPATLFATLIQGLQNAAGPALTANAGPRNASDGAPGANPSRAGRRASTENSPADPLAAPAMASRAASETFTALPEASTAPSFDEPLLNAGAASIYAGPQQAVPGATDTNDGAQNGFRAASSTTQATHNAAASVQHSPAATSAPTLPDSNAPLTPLLPTRQDDFATIVTHQGGLFYLLNVLNRREAQSLLGDYWEQLPNGWGWLYRLGQELQLDEGDPVVTLIAHQLGFASAAELEQLPPLPARADLLALAQRWYGRSGLWHNGLLQLQARVQVSPSHVDLYAGLNAVQLPVRLAGLDINPGWLPWLGKVVSFHYD